MNREDRLVTSWREVLKTRAGRDVIVSILQLTGIDACAFTQSSERRDYALGRQAVGFEVIDFIKATDKMAYPNFLIEVEEDKEDV